MTRRPRVCLLTNEVYPARPGGIGRLMHNFAIQNRDAGQPADLHFLVHGAAPGEIAALEAHFGDAATFHTCPDLGSSADPLARILAGDRIYPADMAPHYRTAYACHLGLLSAEAQSGGPFDYVEIPDLAGWGHAILAARDAGLAHQGSRIVCRLHSSQGMITRAERYSHHPSAWFGAAFDMERHCIAHADLIVGHVASVITANADHYGLGPDWLARTRCDFPPILLDGDTPPPEDTTTPDFAFSSRLQPFKRPDVFIRAAVLFFERNPDYAGRAVVMSYGWDEVYIDGLRALVPDSLGDKVVFQMDYTPAERDALLARSICVIPSNYESLCLFAFEAAQMQRPIILARDCVAFGQSDRWRDRENCLMFDGSFMDLARAMERAVTWRPETFADATPDAPYWDNLPDPPAPRPAPDAPIPVLCYGVRSRHQINALLLRHQTAGLGTHPLHIVVPNHLSDVKGSGAVTIHPASGPDPDGGQIAAIAAGLGAAHVALVCGDHEVSRAFLDMAAGVVAAMRDVALVSSHVRVIDPGDTAAPAITLATGDGACLALQENSVAPAAAVVSVAALAHVDPAAGDYWFDVLARRLALDGARIVIAPAPMIEVQADTPARRNSAQLSAGVADEAGMVAGLPGRMLGLRLHLPRTEVRDTRDTVIGIPEFYHARLVWPDPNPRDFELVGLRTHLGGLLTHPTHGGLITAAALEVVVPEGTRSLWVDVANASDQNGGVCFAVAVAQDVPGPDAFQAMQDGTTPEGLWLTPWIDVPPGRVAQRDFDLPAGVGGRILLLCKLPDYVDSDAYCWAIWKRVELRR